jgi:hypothetical protein
MSDHVPTVAVLDEMTAADVIVQSCLDWKFTVNSMFTQYVDEDSPRWLRAIWCERVNVLWSTHQKSTGFPNINDFLKHEIKERGGVIGFSPSTFKNDKRLAHEANGNMDMLYRLCHIPRNTRLSVMI